MTDQERVEIELVKSYVVRDGKTVQQVIEEWHTNYEVYWFMREGSVVGYANPIPLDGSRHYKVSAPYQWKVIDSKIIAQNIPAMKLTPDLAMIRIKKI